METFPVHVHLPGRTIPGALSTSHAIASHGQPVLLLERGAPHRDEVVPCGPGDLTRWGPAACLLLEAVQTDADDPEEDPTVLDRWNGLCEALRAQGRLPSMARNWLYAGGWANGSTWHQWDRSLVDELDHAPLHREGVRTATEQELTDAGPEGAEGASWTFPDGSGVLEVGKVWDVFDPEARTGGRLGAFEHVHVRRSQHWTFCSRKIRRGVTAGVTLWDADRLIHERGIRPLFLCELCWTRWRDDPVRRK